MYRRKMMKKILLIVDAQYDFINGSLPVGGAEERMNALADFVREHDGDYDLKIATADWHPRSHCSFAENGGTWPVHCVQFTHGASIFQPLFDALYATKGDVLILTKGTLTDREEYSIMGNDKSRKVLQRLFKKKGIEQIDVCGIAGDICVRQTLIDCFDEFGREKFRVLTDFCPSLDGGKALTELLQ